MLTPAEGRRTKARRKYVYRQQLPHLWCCCLIVGTNLLSFCNLTHAISNRNNIGPTMKPTETITIFTFNTNTTATSTTTTTTTTSTPINSPTKVFETEVNFWHTIDKEAREMETKEFENNNDTNNNARWKIAEQLVVKPNTSTVDWLNITDIFSQQFTRTTISGHGTGTGNLFSSSSSTLPYNHTDDVEFTTFHEDCLENHNSMPRIFTVILYSIVCIVGLFGNTLVIWVVLRFSKMQTVTNIYILNLAIADECFLIGIPFLLYTMRICSWKFGDFMCKAYMVSTSITQFTSSIFLLIMAADRYIAVCHPIESPKYRTLRIAKLVSMLAWLTSAILMMPVILFATTVRQEDGINFSCNIDWPEVYKKHSGTAFILYTFLLGFATPLCFILVFYYLVIRKLHTVQQKHKSKEKKRSHRKVTRLVLTVITVYVLCWLPHWISQVSLINAYVGQRELSRFEILLFLLFGCLAYSNSAMNPILYAFLSDNFRKSFSKAFTCMNHQEVEAQLINEHSVFTHKRSGSGSKRKNSRHLSVPRAMTVQNNSFLAPTTVHNCAGGGSSSGTSTSTATTATDKSSNSNKNKKDDMNGVLCTTKEGEQITLVINQEYQTQSVKLEICGREIENQTDV